MRYAWRVARIFGIDIRIDSSWIVIFALFSWFLAGIYFPGRYPDWPPTLYWGLGFLTSLFVFVSVLIHELAHSLVAIQQGEKVHNITLFILGGVAQISQEPEEPLKEFAMSVVGPLASFGLGAIFFLISLLIHPLSVPLAAAAGYLFFINIALGIFNLLPGFPMDGGRVLRSIIWKLTGNLKKATRIASLTGQGFAFMLIFFGILRLLRADLGGLWLILIGWFLHNAAARGYQQVVIQSALEGLKARDLMNKEFETVQAGLSVQDLVDDHILKRKERVFLVTEGDGLEGIVCLEDVKRTPREKWAESAVRDIMTPKDKLQSVGLDADGKDILSSLTSKDVHQIPVMDRGRVAGIICRSDVLKVLQLRSELGV